MAVGGKAGVLLIGEDDDDDEEEESPNGVLTNDLNNVIALLLYLFIHLIVMYLFPGQ
jgi:hypothetical protein